MKFVRRKASPSIPLCSTADIAFLLLIFFMVLAKATSESTIDWKPATTPLKLVIASNTAVTVIIDRQNSVFVNGMPASISDMKYTVQSYLGNRPRGQRIVLVKIDKEVPARVFQQAMSELGEVGADMIRVLEQQVPRK